MEKEANNRIKLDNLFIGFSFIGFCLYFFGIASMYVWLVAILIYLIFLNRVETGIFFLLVGSSLFGRMFASQAFYISVIVVSLLLGIILLYKEIISVINNHPREIIFALLLITFFLIYFLISPMTDYGKGKILKLSIRTLIWITTFLILTENERINPKAYGIIFLMLSLFYLSQAFELYHVRAHNFIDFSSFRLEATTLGRSDSKVGIVSWHTLGYLSLASCAFWISRKGFWSGDKISSLILLSCTFWIIAIAGARQTFFSFGIILLIRYLLFSDNVTEVSNIIKVCFIAALFVFIIGLIGSSYYDQVLFSGDAGTKLNRDVNTPEKIAAINPLFGVGFGCYPLYTHKDYPHNFFLEVICELGLIGLIIFIGITLLFVFLSPNKNYLRFTTRNDLYLFLLAIIFFLRSQISGDVADSMSFMCILIACGQDIDNETILYNDEFSNSTIEKQ